MGRESHDEIQLFEPDVSAGSLKYERKCVHSASVNTLFCCSMLFIEFVYFKPHFVNRKMCFIYCISIHALCFCPVVSCAWETRSVLFEKQNKNGSCTIKTSHVDLRNAMMYK